MSEIKHANELRGAEFKSLTRKKKTWIWTGLLAIVLAVGGFFIHPAAAAAGIVLGARVPLVLTSRADSLAARLASCAVAVLVAQSRLTGVKTLGL